MGELVATAVVAHQPMVMVPEEYRVSLGGTGADTTLIEPGFRRLRQALAELCVNTLVIVDTHWFTTTEHVVAGAAHFKGLYTSEEMPRNICDHPYDYAGAPELAAEIEESLLPQRQSNVPGNGDRVAVTRGVASRSHFDAAAIAGQTHRQH